MNPSDLSVRLRTIADRIDVSLRPSLSAVTVELRSILAAVSGGTIVQSTCPKCSERYVGRICPTCGTAAPEPKKISADLRSISERILSSDCPSASSVAAELKSVLLSIGSDIAAGPTKIVVSDSWTVDEVKALAPEFGGTDIRVGPYGDVGLIVPSDKVEAVQEGGGDFHVFNSWEDVSDGDPEFAFEPVPDGPPGPPKPPSWA